jgi:hypothetical protein
MGPEVTSAPKLRRHEIVGDHNGSLSEDCVAADMLDVTVGVDDDLRRSLAESVHHFLECFSVGLRLSVNQQDAILTN